MLRALAAIAAVIVCGALGGVCLAQHVPPRNHQIAGLNPLHPQFYFSAVKVERMGINIFTDTLNIGPLLNQLRSGQRPVACRRAAVTWYYPGILAVFRIGTGGVKHYWIASHFGDTRHCYSNINGRRLSKILEHWSKFPPCSISICLDQNCVKQYPWSQAELGSVRTSFRMHGGVSGINRSANRSGQSQEAPKSLKPPRPQLLAGDVRLRLGSISRPGLLYQVIAGLSVFFGLALAVVGLAKADLSVRNPSQRGWLALYAAGTIILVAGVIVSKLLRGGG